MMPAAAYSRRRLPPGLNRRVLLFLCHSLLFHIALLGIADILLNFYLVSIGFDGQTIALLQSLPRLSGFLIGLPIGLFADRIGNRKLIALSTVGIALSVAATALTTSLPLLALSRFAWGACFGANQVVKPPFMVTLTDRREHTAQFSWHNLVSMLAVAMGSALGGLLPMLLGGAAPADASAYRASIILAALILLLSALPMLPLGRRGETAVQHRRMGAWRSLPWRRLLRLTFPLFVFGISGGLTFPFFNLFFRDVFALGDSAVGAVIGLGWLVMGAVPLANPLWQAHLGRAGALFALMLLSALAFIGLGMAQALALAVACYALAIGARNTMQPLFQPLLLDSLAETHHNLASSVGLALWNMGWFGATLGFGWLQLSLGYRGIMLLVAVFVLLNGLSIRLTALRND